MDGLGRMKIVRICERIVDCSVLLLLVLRLLLLMCSQMVSFSVDMLPTANELLSQDGSNQSSQRKGRNQTEF